MSAGAERQSRGATAATPPDGKTAAVLLIRHAHAGGRATWVGDDRLRPLSEVGRTQAAKLVALLDGYTVSRVLSSPLLRCTQTVEPLAHDRGLRVEPDDALAEGNAAAALALLHSLAGVSAALCTHGDVIPAVLRALSEEGLVLPPDARWQKASVWALEPVGRRYTDATYLGPP